MPTANIYHDTTIQQKNILLQNFLPDLRSFLAAQLTCGQRKLVANEISIRLISAQAEAMIAPIEIEITAHNYAERADRSDEICLAVRDFVKKQIPVELDLRVWLVLAELGHSWHD